MLYIVATPIGNLSDSTFRALDTLKMCDYILCEDTRQTQKLLSHYEIKKKLVSFHLFNEKAREDEIIHDLRSGKNIAIVSDAGTPLIADPGAQIVKRCRPESIAVTAIPGPCALIAALTLSGFSTSPFQFVGFLPKKPAAFLEEILEYPGTSIAYESPHRLIDTLHELAKIAPTRTLVVARELTKRFETVYTGTASELLAKLGSNIQGELVLVFEGKTETSTSHFSKEFLHAAVQDFVKQGHSVKDAVHIVSKKLRIPRNEVYQAAHLALE